MKSGKRLVGWKDSAACLVEKRAAFWFKIWEEAGCPKSGVLFQIKKTTKSRYKYGVCRLKRRQNALLQKKLALLFKRKIKEISGLRCDVSMDLTLPTHLLLMGFLVIRTLLISLPLHLRVSWTLILSLLILLFTQLFSHLSQTFVLVRYPFQMMMCFRLCLNSK